MGISFLHRLLDAIRPMEILATQGQAPDELWCYGRRARGCGTLGAWRPDAVGGVELTTPGNSQRKPPGWAPRVCKMAWAQHREVFSRVLGSLLALSRPPGSPSISQMNGEAGLGGGDLFPGFGTSHPPCPHLPPGQRTMGHP